YFMGELKVSGWWAFFPVLIAVKLPIAVLGLAAAGLWWRPKTPASGWPFALVVAIPAAILAVALPSNINIGIRHILPLFPFVAIIAAAGALSLVKRSELASWGQW